MYHATLRLLSPKEQEKVHITALGANIPSIDLLQHAIIMAASSTRALDVKVFCLCSNEFKGFEFLDKIDAVATAVLLPYLLSNDASSNFKI
uniref:SFRICE_022621 n=1 Tax=Spodoptera frugiperda TaxID=7108 RepID=A0A2H1VEN8_SPOFR